MECSMTFFDRVQELLLQHGMTSADLSRAIGISQASINGWKNGSLPRADAAYKTAQLLNTSVEYLVNGSGAEPIPHAVLDAAYKLAALPPPFQQIAIDTIESCFRQQAAEQSSEISSAV